MVGAGKSMEMQRTCILQVCSLMPTRSGMNEELVFNKEEPSFMKRDSLGVHFRKTFLRVTQMQLHKSSSQQDQPVANSVASRRNTPESKTMH